MSHHIDKLVTCLRGEGRFFEDRKQMDTADLLFAAANEIERLEWALEAILDTPPIENDNYSRRVFSIAAKTLERSP